MKLQKILGWVLLGLLSAFMLLTAVGKFMATADSEMGKNFIKIGIFDNRFIFSRVLCDPQSQQRNKQPNKQTKKLASKQPKQTAKQPAKQTNKKKKQKKSLFFFIFFILFLSF